MQEEEVGLRQQLTMYTDKYDDFQLVNSQILSLWLVIDCFVL